MTDAAALRMVDAVEELHNLGRGPGPYNSYQGKDGSWCKRLKEVFPQLLAIFQKYSAGEAEVRACVDRFTDERDERDAQAALKKYGKNYRYAFARLVLHGKIMMRGLHTEMAKHSPDPTVGARLVHGLRHVGRSHESEDGRRRACESRIVSARIPFFPDRVVAEDQARPRCFAGKSLGPAGAAARGSA